MGGVQYVRPKIEYGLDGSPSPSPQGLCFNKEIWFLFHEGKPLEASALDRRLSAKRRRLTANRWRLMAQLVFVQHQLRVKVHMSPLYQ